jgi:hypothetical protein
MYNRTIFLLLSVLILKGMTSFAYAETEDYNYNTIAMTGDLSAAEKALSFAKDEAGNERAEKFRERFVERTSGLVLESIEDDVVRNIAAAYQEYWRDTLLEPQRRDQLEVELFRRTHEVLAPIGVNRVLNSPQEIEYFESHLEESRNDRGWAMMRLKYIIEDRGYQALAGRTAPLLELMLWRETRSVTEPIEITDGVQLLNLHYLEDFIVPGWLSYATFGESESAGWANSEGIFIIPHAYDDIEGETFQLSLKHEARHYADVSKYPNISGADREYRAKLTALVFAETDMKRLLSSHQREAVYEDVPHPLANWLVMKDLANEIYGADAPQEWWLSVDYKPVQAAARKLLEVNTSRLDALGALETQGVMRLTE